MDTLPTNAKHEKTKTAVTHIDNYYILKTK